MEPLKTPVPAPEGSWPILYPLSLKRSPQPNSLKVLKLEDIFSQSDYVLKKSPFLSGRHLKVLVTYYMTHVALRWSFTKLFIW